MKKINTKPIFLLAMLLGTLIGCNRDSGSEVIAHRGASGYVTENTLPAVEKAIEMNSDAVEVDIWRTTDDSLVVFHDRNTARLAGDSLVVPESSYDDLRALELPGGNYIPALREVLETLPSDKEIFIEIKCCREEGKAGNVFPMLADMLRETETTGQARLISFNIEKLVDAMDYVPEVPSYWLTGDTIPASEIVDKAIEAGIGGIDVHHSLISEELMDLARRNNLDVYVWTVNDTDRARELADKYGVDGITTDYPDKIANAIEGM